MSKTLYNGQSIVIPLVTGESVTVVAASGTYGIVGVSGSVAGTTIATAATGGTYGPYASGVTMRITSSASSEIDFDAGTAPVIVSDTPVIASKNLTGGIANTIWNGTQAQYDAIVTKDANTVYLIAG